MLLINKLNYNRTFREDVLDAYWFEGLEEVRVLIEQWKNDYNLNHPHGSLDYLSPTKFYQKAVNSGKVQPRKPALDFTTFNRSDNSNFKENIPL